MHQSYRWTDRLREDIHVNGIAWLDFGALAGYHLSVSSGEMHFVPSSPNAWFNLPRIGGVAYAAQESWVQNETIRVSIGAVGILPPINYQCKRITYFLGLPMMKNATRKVNKKKAAMLSIQGLIDTRVICQCALERDLQLFKASDLTEVGEKGLTLRYALHSA